MLQKTNLLPYFICSIMFLSCETKDEALFSPEGKRHLLTKTYSTNLDTLMDERKADSETITDTIQNKYEEIFIEMEANPPDQFPSDVVYIDSSEYEEHEIEAPPDSVIQQNSHSEEMGSNCTWRARSWVLPFFINNYAWLGSNSQSNYLIDYIDVISYHWVDWWFIGGYFISRSNSYYVAVNVVYSYSGSHWWLSMGDHYFYDNPPACQGMPIAWNPITYFPIYY